MGRLTATAAAVLAALAVSSAGDEAYRDQIRRWREEREARLKADDGWLTVAGLFWLHEGENRFGCDPSLEIVLPAGSAPDRAGSFELKSGRTTVRLEPGVRALVGGRALTEPRVLHSDAAGQPDVLEMQRLSLYLIERGGQFAIRLKDKEAAARREFTGLHWYDVSESYRVEARWVQYPEFRPVRLPNVLGKMETMPSPGYAAFSLGGTALRLDGVLEDPRAEELFFILKDQTSGKETYGGGRFLYAALPKAGKVVLDFNKAYNPPCAFTAYATCPLPPRQNWLPVRIEAGEKAYGKGH
jgi:uncharacterized protein (DUF1684 family)